MSSPVAHRRRRGSGRNIRLDVRVNQQEHTGLVARARERGVSIARLLVDSALDAPPPPAAHNQLSAETLELFDRLDAVWHGLNATWRDLNSRVGNNLNQLAHIANETGELPSHDRLAAALAGLEELRQAMIEAVTELHRATIRIGSGTS